MRAAQEETKKKKANSFAAKPSDRLQVRAADPFKPKNKSKT